MENELEAKNRDHKARRLGGEQTRGGYAVVDLQ
jgi:hypothetical protein